MNILVTGAGGFVGKNLCIELERHANHTVFQYDVHSTDEMLDEYTKKCDFVVHLAGVNRPQKVEEFMEGNFGFTSILLDKLKEHNNKSPVLITSSVQAELDNPYGISKKEAEEYLSNYGEENQVEVYIYRLSNVFGKWCKPNYNSVVATFCHNITRDIPIQINEPDRVMELIYIDDLVVEIVRALEGHANRIGKYCEVPVVNKIALGRLAAELQAFKVSRENLQIPDMSNDLVKKLYSTYLSYLPEERFAYSLNRHEDERGSFTEFVRTLDRGQISVNVSKVGITKGQHWHHTKTEKFLVVKGNGLIQFRKIEASKEDGKQPQIIEYRVSGAKMEVIDIPPGYTHNIINVGEEELITIMWANEVFDGENPDTFFEPV